MINKLNIFLISFFLSIVFVKSIIAEEFFFDKIDEYEAGVESNTASRSEHKKDKNNAKKKYANRRVICRKYALL